jgi:uncharacterized membrane protein YkoI
MKKILIIPAVIGLLAVPSLAMAQHGADNNNANNIHQEDQQHERNDNAATPAIPGVQPATPSPQALQHRNNDQNHPENDNDEDQVTLPEGSISLEQAKAIAMGVFPNGTIQKVETESEQGMVVFSVRFTDGSRVDVNAADGSIVQNDQDENENEADNSASHGDHEDGDRSGSGNSNRGRGSNDD